MIDLYTDNDKTLMKELKTQINGKCKDFQVGHYKDIKQVAQLSLMLTEKPRHNELKLENQSFKINF